MKTKNFILKNKIITVLRRIPSSKLIDLCGAITGGGIRCIEVAVDQSGDINDTLDAIYKIRENFSDIVRVGAGTVLTCEQLNAVALAGAEYVVSPDANPEIISLTKEKGLVSIPGAFTATEISTAYRLGADFVKVFPAGSMGPGYIKSLKAPFSHIPLLAVGGIPSSMAREYIDAGACGIGISGMLVNKTLLDNCDYQTIRAEAQKYVDALR